MNFFRVTVLSIQYPSFFFLIFMGDRKKDIMNSSNSFRKDNKKRKAAEPFQVFCLINRKDIQAKNLNLSPSEVTSVLSQIWRSLDAKKREKYILMANKYNSTQVDDVIEIPHQEKAVSGDMYIPYITIVPRSNTGKKLSDISCECLKKEMSGHIYKNNPDDQKDDHNSKR